MAGILLGLLYVAALATTYYVLWRREERRTKQRISQHLADLNN